MDVARGEVALTREDLIEGLTYLCFTARREFPVLGTPEFPTPWDRRHAQIDELLTELDELEGRMRPLDPHDEEARHAPE